MYLNTFLQYWALRHDNILFLMNATEQKGN